MPLRRRFKGVNMKYVLLAAFIVASLISVYFLYPYLIGQSLPGEDDIDPEDMLRFTVTINPTDPESSQIVAVTANIQSLEDSLSVTQAIMYYKSSTMMVELAVQMQQSGTYWTASIPAFDNGVSVNYWVDAITTDGIVQSDDKFYTVYDPPPPPPPPTTPTTEVDDTVIWQLTVIDNMGEDISDTFRTATIQGTVQFEVEILNADWRVYGVNLELEGISRDASPGGIWQFEQISNTTYHLDFDTTVVTNGEYYLNFVMLLYPNEEYIAGGGTGDYELWTFSTFRLGMEDGQLKFLLLNIDDVFLIIGIVVIGSVISLFLIRNYLTKSRHKRGRKKK